MSGSFTTSPDGGRELGPDGEPLPDDGGRYVHQGELGRGSTAVVHAVLDRVFDRVVAMKVARGSGSPLAHRRFQDEARITGQLDHPGVVAVHDVGLTDGRPWMVMQRVDGETLRAVLRRVDPATEGGAGRVRRALQVLRGVADTLAFAHERGVHHRDLKPSNVMVGRFGEVRVMDWGLARRNGAGTPSDGDVAATDPSQTAIGAVTGTPRYLAPEQAEGSEVGPPADVYAMGAMLVECVTGAPLRTGADAVVMLWQATRQVVVPDVVPDALADLARRAMALDPDARPTASTFAAAVGDWLAGAEREDLARARISEAAAAQAEVDELLRREAGLVERRRVLDGDLERVLDLWAAQDELAALAVRRAGREVDVDALLNVARAHAPELADVDRAIARVARDRAARAEEAEDVVEAARHRATLARHDRGEHAAWLIGDGTVSLRTEPSGVPVVARPVKAEGRRRIPGDPVALGVTPLHDVPLAAGSWLFDVGGVTIPVFLRRADRWDQVPPGADTPETLPLARPTDGAYVPAGYALLGGDPLVRNPRPRARVWVDGFVVRRHPVTHAEYLAFLRDVVARHGLAAAERHAPSGRLDPTLHVVDGDYHFLESEDGELAELPVFNVSQGQATAFAAWESERTGRPWRLPTRAEREKAGRGVDGRRFPWGDDYHPTWANTASSFAAPRPVAVGHFAVDVSVYGVGGLAGNISDWLADSFADATADPPRAQRARRDPAEPYVVFAGGGWNSGGVYARCANFGRYAAAVQVTAVGFRLCRDLVPEDT